VAASVGVGLAVSVGDSVGVTPAVGALSVDSLHPAKLLARTILARLPRKVRLSGDVIVYTVCTREDASIPVECFVP
jgi:hypothetical protein